MGRCIHRISVAGGVQLINSATAAYDSTMSGFITRFAPSPTGTLHLGHAFSALTAFHAAQDSQGRFLLRIEDIDQTRCQPEFETGIYEDLSWLGLTWETPVRRQSEHFELYEEALESLKNKGVLYRCFKTRKEIAEEIARAPHLSANGPEGTPFIGTVLKTVEERALLAEGKPYAWRLSIRAAQEVLKGLYADLEYTVEEDGKKISIKATPEIFGDIVIARKDFNTSYHLSSVYDDALQGITYVIRGEDLATAAHFHVLLQVLLNLPTPIYRHHRLILNKKGERLSKRDKATSLKALREQGMTIDDVEKKLGF